MKRNILFFAFLLFVYLSNAQTFTYQSGVNLSQVYGGSISWGDYDNDGYQDILMTGYNSTSYYTSKIYKNNGNGTFTEQSGISITGVYFSASDWGDYNNDGFLDFVICGLSSSGKVTKLYKNNGNNTFTEQSSVSLAGVSYGSLDWGDYDNDGDLDLLLAGYGAQGPLTKLYKNNGGGAFIEATNITFTAVSNSTTKLVDFNNDGHLDVVLSGSSSSGLVTKFYSNNGNGTFSLQSGINIVGYNYCSSAWGDYDADGDLDVVFSGALSSGYATKLYKNNGNNSFTEQTSVVLTGGQLSSIVFSDCDNDGDLDLLITGITGSVNYTKLYINNGAGAFTEKTGMPFTGVSKSSVAFADYDNDGDLDVLISGISGSTASTKFYRNDIATVDIKPSTPLNLKNDTLLKKLQWSKSTDDHTASKSISYNIAFGTNINDISIFSSQSNNATGYHRVSKIGNVQLDTFMYYNLGNFRFDSTYFIKVQAIDNTYKGSVFSTAIQCKSSLVGSITNNDTSIICGNPVQLSVTVNGDPSKLSYSWTPSAGLSSTTISNPIAKPSVTTWYKVTGTYAALNMSFTDSVLITVTPVKVALGTDVSKYCGDSVVFNPTTTYTGLAANLSWTYSPVTGLSNAYIKSPTAKPSTTTNYILTMTSLEGCIAKDTVKITVNPITVNAGIDLTKTCGDSATLSPSTTYAGIASNVNWTWTPSTGLSASNVKNPLAKPNVTTSYIVNLSSTEGCTAKDTIKIIVNPMSVNAGSDRSLICGDSVTLVPVITYGGKSTDLSYSWSPSASLKNPSVKDAIAKPGSTTNYIVQVTSNMGCSAKDTIKVNVNPFTVNGGTAQTKACGDSAMLNPTTNYPGNASNLSWSWAPTSSLSNFAIKNPYAKPNISTTYTATVTSVEGCNASGTTTVLITPIKVNAGNDITKICGDSTMLIPSTTYSGNPANLSWSWSPATGLSATGIKNPYLKIASTADYVVTLNSLEGCTASDTLRMIINPMTVFAGNDLTRLCGNPANLNPSTNYPGKPANLSWTWSPGSGLSASNTKTPIAKPSVTTNYILQLTSSEGCTAKDTLQLIITPLTLDAGSDLNNVCGNSIGLNPVVNYPGTSTSLNWSWTPATGLTSSTLKNPFAKTKNTIKYYVTTTSVEGCTAQDSLTIFVTPLIVTTTDASKVCGSTTMLNASVNSNSSTVNYIWTPTTGLSNPYIHNPVANPLVSTTYYVNVSDGVCNSSDTAIVGISNANYNPNFIASQALFIAPPFAVQFTNTTPSLSQYDFVWDFGDGTTLSSNNQSVYHTYTYNGLYTVSLIASHKINHCSDTTVKTDFIYCSGGVSCNYSASILQPGPITKCLGDTVLLKCNTDPSFFYQWRKNGISISGATSSQLIVSESGTYTVTISKANGCAVTSSPVQVYFNTLNAPQILIYGVINPCTSDTIKLYTSLAYSSYLWSNGVTTPYTYITQSGNYTVTVTDMNGCSSVSSPLSIHTSYLNDQEICIVSVDAVSAKNKIVWNRANSSVISGYNIYKESNSANIYTVLANISYSSGNNSYIDAASNPDNRADRYKITAIDTCGEETPISDFHKTNHLAISKGIGNNWNLNWDGYEGFDFPTYSIYRGTTPSNLSVIASIQSNLFSYTDNPGAGTFYYKIGVVSSKSCTGAKAENDISFSNTVANTAEYLDKNKPEIQLNVVPNPNHGEFTLLYKGVFNEDCEVKLVSNTGELLYCEKINSNELNGKKLNVSHLGEGVYSLILNTKYQIVVRKLVIL